MKGFLLGKFSSSKLRFTPSLPVQHAKDLGESVADADLWSYAKANDLIIVRKDADFSDRILVSEPPPKIVHLRFGNLRRNEFHEHLASVWTKVEDLIKNHKLVNIYLDRLEAVKAKDEGGDEAQR